MEVEKKELLKDSAEWIYCALIALVLAVTIRYFICTPTVVKQSSMYDTLESNQRVILNRWTRTIKGKIERGEIITFESPSKLTLRADEVDLKHPEAIYLNRTTNIFDKFKYSVLEINKTSYIKRVIGLAGDHIVIKNGCVYRNGTKLDEDYILEGAITDGDKFYDVIVPEGYVYVMGDNREKSTDSRAFGCIPVEKIDSKLFIRFWPLKVFGFVK